MTDSKEVTVNQRIKFLIEDYQKCSQKFFAEKTGVSQSAISSLFSKRENRPGLEMLQKIAIAYPEISLDWLLIGRGEMLRQGEAASEERVSETSVSLDGQTHVITPDQWELIKNPILAMTTEKVRTQVLASLSNRTYHFGDIPTPGLEYDDRISNRLNISKKELAEWLTSPEFKKLPHTIIGKRIIVTEQGLRDFLGDSPLLR